MTALDDLETHYLGAITSWHQFYNALEQEEKNKLYNLNQEIHNLFAEMQDIIRITRFGNDEEKQQYSRKV